MVASQNLRGDTKHLVADDDDIPKKPAKKVKSKRASFSLRAKTQIPLSSQDNKKAGFTSLLPLSSNIATPSRIALKESEPSCFGLYSDEVEPIKLELASLISPCRRQKPHHQTKGLLLAKLRRFLMTKNQRTTYHLPLIWWNTRTAVDIFMDVLP